MTLVRTPLVLAMACCFGVVSLVRAQDAPASASPYQDRLIENGALRPDVDTGDAESASPAGLPRQLDIEGGAGETQTETASSQEEGLRVGALWETTNWGAFSFDGVLRRGSGSNAAAAAGGVDASLTVWQRGMPVEGGWLVDNGLGVLNSPLLPLARNQYRFILPSAPMVGAQTEWKGNGWDVVGAAGEPGLFEGGHWSGFHATGGTAVSAGAQTALSPTWTVGALVLSENDALPAFVGADGVIRGDADTWWRSSGSSLFASADWSGAPFGTDIQASLLSSRASAQGTSAWATPEGSSQGVWLDATTPAGSWTHHYGAFHLDPGLVWGINPMPGDLEGGYYRFDYQRGRWTWSGGVDEVRSIDGQGTDGAYATGGGRYQWTSTLGVGASATARAGDEAAGTASVYADKKTNWGTTRIQVDAAHDPVGQSGSRLTLDQAFPFEGPTHASAALSIESTHDATFPGATHRASFSVYGSRDFGRWSVDANLRAVHGQGPNAESGVDGTLGLNWRIAPQWTVTGSFYKSQGTQRSAFVLDPLVSPTFPTQAIRDEVWFVSLRYTRRAGTPAAIVGGARTHGVGGIEGSVFLDDNSDGARNAGEAPAPRITVVLDGRYSVATDEAGRFSFPEVAAGAHTLAVVSDNLPLPWSLTASQSQRSLVVPVRGVVRVDVGARRRGAVGSGG